MMRARKKHHQGGFMEAMLFVSFLLVFVLMAPPQTVAITATGLLIASLAVRASAGALSRGRVRLAIVFRSLVLAFLLSMLAAFALMHLVPGAPPRFQDTLTHPGANLLAFGAYAWSYRIGLGLSWPHAALVAALSSLTVGACIWLAVLLRTSAVH
jgi:hypothetical protein